MPPAPPHHNVAVDKARLQIAFAALPASLTLSGLLAGLIALVLFLQTGHATTMWWYASFLIVMGGRVWLYRKFRRQDPSLIDSAVWQRRFFIATLAAGVCWGSICVVLPPRDAILQLLLAFALAGTAAGAATSLSAEREAAIAFVIAAIAPLATRLMLDHSQAAVAMGTMVLLFMGMMIGSVLRYHERIIDMIVAQLDAQTQRRELATAHRQLQRLNDRMHIATQTAKAGVWEWDIAAQQQEWDEQVYRMFDLEPETDPSSYAAWRTRVHPQDLATIDAKLRAALISASEFTIEFRVLRADGTERHIKTSCLIQRNDRGRATHVIGMNWDITDLRRVDRMKREFVSTVSHELRTPLTSIRASLGLLHGGAIGEIGERGQQLLDLARRNADRLAVLIDDLLDMEKIESGKLRINLSRQPLQPLLEQAITVNSTIAAMQGVQLRLQAHADCEVNVDATRLLQVLTNLLSNAIKFSPREGVVTVDARIDGRSVRLEVHDDGPGITTEFQKHIFGKFCQDDSSDTRSKGGSGLGLSISRALVEQMAGTIGFATAPDHGTTFHIVLPLLT